MSRFIRYLDFSTNLSQNTVCVSKFLIFKYSTLETSLQAQHTYTINVSLKIIIIKREEKETSCENIKNLIQINKDIGTTIWYEHKILPKT